MTEQIKDSPPVYQIEKHFGPSICHIQLPERGVKNLTKMTDDLLKNPNTVDHGKHLVSHIHNEKYIFIYSNLASRAARISSTSGDLAIASCAS